MCFTNTPLSVETNPYPSVETNPHPSVETFCPHTPLHRSWVDITHSPWEGGVGFTKF